MTDGVEEVVVQPYEYHQHADVLVELAPSSEQNRRVHQRCLDLDAQTGCERGIVEGRLIVPGRDEMQVRVALLLHLEGTRAFLGAREVCEHHSLTDLADEAIVRVRAWLGKAVVLFVIVVVRGFVIRVRRRLLEFGGVFLVGLIRLLRLLVHFLASHLFYLLLDDGRLATCGGGCVVGVAVD